MSNNESNEKLLRYNDNINRVDTWVTTTSENGLFKEKNDNLFKLILDNLKEARESIDTQSIEHNKTSPNFVQCSDALSKAANYYSQAVDSAPLSWRFLNIYAGHLWIYLITFLFITFAFYYFDIDRFLSLKVGVSPLSVDAATWGVIGGILRGIWWLWRNVSDRKYRKTWMVWFISTPFLGGIFGAISYFLIFAGLLAVSQNSNEVLNPMIVIVVSALAGFNWEWIVEQFNRVRERF